MDLLGQLHRMEREEVLAFTVSYQHSSGGFRGPKKCVENSNPSESK